MRKVNFIVVPGGEKHRWIYTDEVLIELNLSNTWKTKLKEERDERCGFHLEEETKFNDKYDTSIEVLIMAHVRFKWDEKKIIWILTKHSSKIFPSFFIIFLRIPCISSGINCVHPFGRITMKLQ